MPHGAELLIEALLDGGAEVDRVSVALTGLVDNMEKVGLHFLIEVHSHEMRFVGA